MNIDMMIKHVEDSKLPAVFGVFSNKPDEDVKKILEKVGLRIKSLGKSVILVKTTPDREGRLEPLPISQALLADSYQTMPIEEIRRGLSEVERNAVILLEVPPLTEGNRSLSLLSCCDKCYMTVDFKKTRRPVIQHAKNELESAGLSLDGLIFKNREFVIPENIYNWLF